jgi:hypothetical protein
MSAENILPRYGFRFSVLTKNTLVCLNYFIANNKRRCQEIQKLIESEIKSKTGGKQMIASEKLESASRRSPHRKGFWRRLAPEPGPGGDSTASPGGTADGLVLAVGAVFANRCFPTGPLHQDQFQSADMSAQSKWGAAQFCFHLAGELA